MKSFVKISHLAVGIRYVGDKMRYGMFYLAFPLIEIVLVLFPMGKFMSPSSSYKYKARSLFPKPPPPPYE